MSLIEFFRSNKETTATTAKERLQIIVAHERLERRSPDYLPEMKKDILAVISKYTKVSIEDVQVQFDQSDDKLSVLELNITLPYQ